MRVIDRAQALMGLLAKSAGPESVSRAIDLSRELLASGEWRLCLELCESIDRVSSHEAAVQVDALRADALLGRGDFVGALKLIEQRWTDALEAGQSPATPDMRWLRIQHARAQILLHRMDEAKQILRQEHSSLVTLPDSAMLGWCALLLGIAAVFEGQLEDARQRFAEASVSAGRTGDQRLLASAAINAGFIKRQRCHWGEAQQDFLDAQRLWQRLGNHAQHAAVLRSLALVDWKRGRLQVARQRATESVRVAASTGSDESRCFGLQLRALIELHAGDMLECGELMSSAEELVRSTVLPRAAMVSAEFAGDLELEKDNVEAALSRYSSAFEAAFALAPRGDIVAELRRRRAECFHLLGRHDEAYAEAQLGLQHTRELGDRYEEAATYRVAALAAAALYRPEEAKQLFEQGFSLFEDIETPYEWGKLWMAFGDWLASDRSGSYRDPRMAIEAYHAAHYRFETMGAKAKLAEVNARIARALPSPDALAVHSTPRAARTPPRPRPARTREADLRIEWARERFGVISANPAIFDILGMVEKLAKSRTSVLVLGESGTGKELIAHALHQLSGRTGEFVAINCATLPKDVIESELFGHVAGAFTGAAREKVGLLEVCEGGTVFLDEISEMSIELQSRLLRFLESGEIRRVGATKVKKISTRVVAASNREEADLRGGRGFREDLYFRLAQPSLKLPPLRLRGARDIELLAEHFLARHCAEEQKSLTLSEAALEKLARYSWPGNIRELRSTMSQRAVLNADGDEIQPEDLRLESDPTATPGTLQEELDLTERRRIEEALRMSRNSKADAARLLGIPRTTLLNRMAKLGIETV